ncbi:MAG: UDP-N-acetylmuramate--L-alanine ligase [Crocinitomicaceae bacterium]
MNLKNIHTVYFIGIGGIGMSALARYFHVKGKHVIGYDKTPTHLTEQLESEGIKVHFEDLGDIVLELAEISSTLVVYTPAIPKNMGELIAFQSRKYNILKRSEVLGYITRTSKGIGVAGTHGKTTTSTLLAHVLHQTVGCNAFLGGISTNYNSNLILDAHTEWTVMEADEFDRSFLQLHPFAGVLTNTDADHLDIYQDSAHVIEGFHAYINQINSDGFLLIHQSIQLSSLCRQITYSAKQKADIYADNFQFVDEQFVFDVHVKGATWKNVALGIPGIHNAENALAVIGVCLEIGISEKEIRQSLASFLGVKRRFEYQIKRNDLVYIDDYAHHPTEIKALVQSVRMLYPNKNIVGIFQPHLFSRTRDFMDEFAAELSQLDEVILLPIYPARELPMEGITSEALAEKISNKSVSVKHPEDVINYLKSRNQSEIILTIGAGDIDKIVEPLKQVLT